MKPLLSFCAALLLAFLLGGPACLAQQATIRAGDTLDIRLSGVPPEEISAISATQTVDDGGMLNIAYIGKVKVTGLDASQAQQLIEGKLRSEKIFTNPTVTVTVQSNFRLVNVSGEVRSSGRLTYTADLTVMSSIAGAGGFTDFADKKHVKLVRGGKVQVVDTTKISKDPSVDIKVLPGDQIVVPQAGTFSW
ncbi:MAG: polysaccharide export protein [Chthoniobacteraceae bacterium]|nr:polysaccharide export protein [Chthoniobacteraceae bacterium]